jgi:N utilization substance protein A
MPAIFFTNMAAQTARTEFAQALKAVATQTGLEVDVIIEKVKEAVVAAYKRDARETGTDVEAFEYTAEIHPVSGEMRVFSTPLTGGEKKDVTPPGFGRIAAQTAKQVIHQKLREAERGAVMEQFQEKVGGLISGLVLRFDGGDVRVEVGKTEGIMPYDERVATERLSLNQRLTFFFKEIQETAHGQEIILSRKDSKFVEKLFEREVPEIGSHSVEIKGIAREAGVRTKIAVWTASSGVDPVGSCVGQKGVRVQAVTNELGGERVDIILWNSDAKEFVKSALSPVEVISIKVSKSGQLAKVVVPEDQLSIAIGKDGQNVRLASKLTGWEIDIAGDGKKKTVTEDKVQEGI